MNSDDAPTSRDQVGLFLATMVDALFGSVVRTLLYATVELFRRLAGAAPRPDAAVATEAATRSNTVLVVGLGRSGKTQLIRSLIGEDDTAPERTLNFEVTSRSIGAGDTRHDLKFIDYRGQDFGQLISCLFQEQASADPAVRYGEINTLMLVVDLFPFVDGEDPDRTHERYSRERVAEHLCQWNTTALDAVMGLLTQGSLRHVCLFINKFDMWQGATPRREAEQAVKEDYRPLIDQLRRRTDGVAGFDVVVGSARGGDGIWGASGIRAKLFRHGA